MFTDVTSIGAASLNISYRNPEAVEAFLAAYPNISPFIEAAMPFLLRHFGQPLDIVLEVMDYPEPGAEDELVGWIQAVGDVEESLDKLEEFEAEWFLEHMVEVDYRFNLNIECR